MPFINTRSIAAGIAASVAVLALTVTTAAASPTTSDGIEISAAEESQSRAFMSKFGVPEQTQDQLLDALANEGDVGLANSPDATPVSVDLTEMDGSTFEVAVYADGSISVVEREIPVEVEPGLITPMAVTGCTVTSGSGYVAYQGCKVQYQTHVFLYGFYANFSITPGYDSIDTVFGQFQGYAIGHSRDSWNLRILKRYENSAGPAHAELAIEYTILPGVGQVTKGVRLKVGSNSYWQENS